jgi:hypothetical protein
MSSVPTIPSMHPRCTHSSSPSDPGSPPATQLKVVLYASNPTDSTRSSSTKA